MLSRYSHFIGFEMELAADWMEATTLNNSKEKSRSVSIKSSSTIPEMPLPDLPQMPARATLIPSRKSGELVRENTQSICITDNDNPDSPANSWYSWFWGSEQC